MVFGNLFYTNILLITYQFPNVFFKFIVTSDLIKRNKKQARNKGVPSTPEVEPIPEIESGQQQVLMIEIENLKDEPYDKTMEIKVCTYIL